MDKGLKEKIELGYKRLALVNSVIAFIFAIPTIIMMNFYEELSSAIVLLYMMVLCVCILWSPTIVNKIWKN